MRIHHILTAFAFAVLLGGTAGATAARAGDFIPGPARIVGYWNVDVAVRPCIDPGAPATRFLGLNMFHAGGTLSDANTFPPTARGPGMGVWSYDPLTGKYNTRMQFARFVNGVFDGLQDVRQVATMIDNDHYTTEVQARVLNADGSVRALLCGTAAAERVSL